MIGLIGKARSGKSSVAKVLNKEFGYSIMPMADTLRQMLFAGIPFLKEECLRADKEKIIPELGVTGRHLLQSLGHEWGRNIHPDLWLMSLQRQIEILKLDITKVVIDDVRYDNEVAWIKKHGGTIIGVDRPSLKTDEAWREHKSEHGIDLEKSADLWVGNISCYETDLEFSVLNMMSNLLDPHEFLEA